MTIISDNFNRADGDAGANWLNVGGTENRLWIAGNKASVNPIGLIGYGVFATPLETDNIRVTCTMRVETGASKVLIDAGSDAGFVAGFTAILDADVSRWELYEPNLTSVAWDDPGAVEYSTTYDVRLDIIDNVGYLYVDDVLRLTLEGGTPAAGRHVAVGVFAADLGQAFLDDFLAEDIGGEPPVEPPATQANNIEAALYGRLLVVLEAGTPVYLHEMPQEITAPFVVFEASERSDVRGSAPLSSLEVRVACYAPAHAAAEALAAQARQGLELWSMGMPGLILHPMAFANQEGGYEAEFGVYRSAVTFAAQAVQWAIV